MKSYVTHLECGLTGKSYPAGEIHGLSEAGRPLLVRYDLERLAAEVTKADIAASDAPGFWRYAPMLPVEDPANRVSLGEVVTPIIALERSAPGLGAAAGARAGQGRGAAADGLLQGARACARGVDGQELRHPPHGDPDQRQCGRGARGLCAAGGDPGERALPRRHARDQHPRDPGAGGGYLARQRSHQRLRQDRRRRARRRSAGSTSRP